jgi:CheY-like chemotaxis protein
MLRILLVEDDPRIRESMELLLRLDGHLVESCGDSNAARQRLKEGRFDVAFVDHALPGGLSGAELCAVAPEEPAAPRFVLMTGHLMVPEHGEQVAAVLIKPFGRREIVSLLDRLCPP